MDGSTPLEQAVDEIAADKTGAAGDKVSHEMDSPRIVLF
jgi:hypothetical protein